MWKLILDKLNAAILTHWSQVVSLILGALLGVFVLAGLMSCSAVTAVEEGVSNVDGKLRDIPYAGRVYEIPSNLVGDVYNLGKDTVEGVVDVITPDEEGDE
jgi:hypothetical protein